MANESKHKKHDNNNSKENFTIQITNPMLYDRLHVLSAEYSISKEQLVNVAIRRLIDDVKFVRSLRMGEIGSE